ncbi:uncharacterized protein LOC116258427 [Nymphaea colorata]|nr:uncharacterized protein LOC116258427 [Nymphaea colorata]
MGSKGDGWSCRRRVAKTLLEAFLHMLWSFGPLRGGRLQPRQLYSLFYDMARKKQSVEHYMLSNPLHRVKVVTEKGAVESSLAMSESPAIEKKNSVFSAAKGGQPAAWLLLLFCCSSGDATSESAA